MSNILSEETTKFFNSTEDELQKEKSRYGNLFLNARKKQIERLFYNVPYKVDKTRRRDFLILNTAG